MPLAKAGDAKISSSYSVDVEKTKSGLVGSLPDYIKRCGLRVHWLCCLFVVVFVIFAGAARLKETRVCMYTHAK